MLLTRGRPACGDVYKRQHQSLFQRENHRHLLDDFGGDPARELLNDVAGDAARLKELSQKIRGLEKDEREMERQKEMFLYELKEIRAAKLIDGEEESLESDKKILVNSCLLYTSPHLNFKRKFFRW